MEVSPATLELLCAVGVVRHSVAAERLVGGVAITVVVSNVLAQVRQWALSAGSVMPPEMSTLGRAAGKGSVEGVLFCLGGMAPERRQVAVRTAMMVSVRYGHLPVMRWCVEEGGVNVRAISDGTLAESARHGRLAIVRWLVEQGGANVHWYGNEALKQSAWYGHLAVVRWLVEEGGADVHANGDEALWWGASKRRVNVVEWLVSAESGVEWTAAAVGAVLSDEYIHDEAVRAVLQAAVDRLGAEQGKRKRQRRE